MAVQSDGEILAGGYSSASGHYDFALVRYNVDGTLDTSFYGDGKVTTAIGTGDDRGGRHRGSKRREDPTRRGIPCNGTYFDFALVRYNADGTLDTSF